MSSEPTFTMVIPPGTLVEIGEGEEKIKAHVLSIYIKGDFYVEYECIWFNGNTLEKEYFPAHLVTPRELERSSKAIGFHRDTTGSPRTAT